MDGGDGINAVKRARRVQGVYSELWSMHAVYIC